MEPTTTLPYFEILLDALEKKQPNVVAAFGRHVHWGYWPDPARATGTVDDFARAAERLCVRVCDVGQVREGQRILDVGCGFGGTIASLNERLSPVELVGLNIDPRQLERARHEVIARPGNTISFHEGDACAMPFEDASFDVVLALECAFHFDSRARFLAEARRVLRKGGRLALCDFVPAPVMAPFVGTSQHLIRAYLDRYSGRANYGTTIDQYKQIARDAGLSTIYEEDITKGTLPSYPVVRKVLLEMGREVAIAIAGAMLMGTVSQMRLLRYVILAFEKNG